MPPLICTTNTLLHTDYGIPVVANKSTDYRTTTGTYHRYMPNVPQEFDCRVKARIKPELKIKDVANRDEVFKTLNNEDYYFKQSPITPLDKCVCAKRATEIQYTRNVEEKIFSDPPPPRSEKLSEMKDAYYMRFTTPDHQLVYAPAITEKCEIRGLGRDEQPAVRPEHKGFWKLLDPYLTTSRLDYIPYDQNQVLAAKEDLLTFYNASGVYKGGNVQIPGPSGNKTIYDKTVFTNVLPNRIIPEGLKPIPHMGMQTEYRGNFLPQTFSEFYPYISDSTAVFCETLGVSGPWQNLCPPAMYCTDYCHIGHVSMYPVRAAVDIGAHEEILAHKPCNFKFTDMSV